MAGHDRGRLAHFPGDGCPEHEQERPSIMRNGDRYDMSVDAYQLLIALAATCGLLAGTIIGLLFGWWIF